MFWASDFLFSYFSFIHLAPASRGVRGLAGQWWWDIVIYSLSALSRWGQKWHKWLDTVLQQRLQSCTCSPRLGGVVGDAPGGQQSTHQNQRARIRGNMGCLFLPTFQWCGGTLNTVLVIKRVCVYSCHTGWGTWGLPQDLCLGSHGVQLCAGQNYNFLEHQRLRETRTLALRWNWSNCRVESISWKCWNLRLTNPVCGNVFEFLV